MIVKGSMNYTASGRKKKPIKTKKRKEYDGRDLSSSSNSSYRGDSVRSHSTSTAFNGQKLSPEWEAERRAISSNYTIAPAYNKGAYQVIGKNEVEDIGR